MTVIPILIYWIFALWGLFSRRPVLIYLLTVTMPLGAFAAVPPQFSGGLTLGAETMTAMLICIRQFLLHRSGPPFLVLAISRINIGMLLFLFWMIAVFTTIFSPRLFEGQIIIVPVRGLGAFIETAWLRPTTQNISQLSYLTISIGFTFALCHMLKKEKQGSEVLARALVWGAFMVILTGFLDLLSQYVPITPFLAPFRTATYALLTEVYLQDGAKRVVGLMPEASAYGFVCVAFLSLLWFMRHVFPAGASRNRVIVICLLLTIFTFLSTSSASYIGLGLVFFLAVLEWIWRAGHLDWFASALHGIHIEFFVVVLGFGFFSVLFIAMPDLFDPITARVNRMVFEKTESSSFEERNAWTRISLEAGLSTYLMGVGVGSTRASNAMAAVLSATGILGFLFYYAFVLQCLLRPIDKRVQQFSQGMARACRWSFLPTFVMGLLVGTSPDLGINGAMRWAVILAFCAGPLMRRPHHRAILGR